MRKLITAVLLLLTCSKLLAQPTNVSISTTACPGGTFGAGCTSKDLTNQAGVGIQITGTFSGTLQFEQMIDGSNWVSVPATPYNSTTTVTSTTATGLWTISTVAKNIRVRFSAYSSGTAVVSFIATQARAASVSSGGGAGNPGGSDTQLQYNNAGVFGGTTGWTTNGTVLTSTSTGNYFKNQPTENTSGSFGAVVGVGSNLPDTKPDHTMIIGWNVDNAVAGAGSNGLSFESYCSLGTGCLAGAGGQSETYFSMDDGKGNPGVRPLGFFQRKNDDNSPYIYTIARSDDYTWFNAPASGNPMMGLTPSQFTIRVPIATPSSGAWLVQQGVSLIEKGSGVGGVSVAPSSGVDIGNTGEYITNIQTNHIRMVGANFEDAAGHVRINVGGGDDAEHLSLQNSAGNVLLRPQGSTANVDLELNPKGNGSILLNFPGSGTFKADGKSGVTVSGVSCTITEITKGIITGANCS